MPDPAGMPDTVTEAVAFLRANGYEDDVVATAATIEALERASGGPAEVARIDHSFRFEGPTDPGDEAIVLGVTWPQSGAKGVFVSAYGHDAGPEAERFLALLGR